MVSLNSKSFDEAINTPELVVVDFFATWCMPCRRLQPILERVESKLKDVKFYSYDIDDEEIAKRYRIFSVPTILCFKDGKIVDSMVGLKAADEIIDFINNCK